MRPGNHINPDHHLRSGLAGRPTREEGRAAWEAAYGEPDRQLLAVGEAGLLVVVCGLQGSGKSTWIEANAQAFGPKAVFFDGALPSRQHRLRALQLAARHATPAIAVWLNAPLSLALARNALRSGLARVPEAVIRHVHEQLEPPTQAEGFDRVIEVRVAEGI